MAKVLVFQTLTECYQRKTFYEYGNTLTFSPFLQCPLKQFIGKCLIFNHLPMSNFLKKTIKHYFFALFSGFFVTRMGLEPMTPTLKVLCSTS